MAADSFSLADFDVIGFDLDHTICKYKLNEVFPLIYYSLAKNMVEKKGHDKSLLEPFELDKDFMTKGLVFDVITGDLLKLSGDGHILKASHGTRILSDEEIQTDYGKGRLWSPDKFQQLKETLKQTDDMRYFENYFDMTGAVLCARMVDIIDKKADGKRPKTYYSFLSDMWQCYGYSYNRENFAANKGLFFPPIKENPEKYFQQCSKEMKDWLKSLKAAGKVVFLCTTSHVDYARHLLQYIIGPDWQSYFDVCCTYARKPGFFTGTPETRPFYELVDDVEQAESIVTTLEPDNIYSQGNALALLELLKKLTGKDDPKVVYVGDSLRSDVFPMASLNWSSLLILEEMQAEGLITNGDKENDGSDGDTNNPPPKRKKYSLPDALEIEYLLSSKWGSFFTTNNNISGDGKNENQTGIAAMNTLWGYFIKTYSDIAVPGLEYIIDLPLDHKFPTFSVEKNRSGFYPALPKALATP
ncbi:5'-nucleotidase domain-containing protein 1-like isoform X2 [Ptychodera flava]|uniref:5'-nucleotidase domain-containing protein 1-like isoform X2 n=1 Tax=Ptychodera flava TaxID=63121 RepID=UPI00396A0D65